MTSVTNVTSDETATFSNSHLPKGIIGKSRVDKQSCLALFQLQWIGQECEVLLISGRSSG